MSPQDSKRRIGWDNMPEITISLNAWTAILLLLGNTTITSFILWFIQHQLRGVQSRNLEKIKADLQSSNFASSSLYKQRIDTIFELDDAIRRSLGPCHALPKVNLSMKDMNILFDNTIDEFQHISRRLRLKGQLVFDDQLYDSANSLECLTNKIASLSRQIISQANSDNPDTNFINTSLKTLSDKLLPDVVTLLKTWTTQARVALTDSPNQVYDKLIK